MSYISYTYHKENTQSIFQVLIHFTIVKYLLVAYMSSKHLETAIFDDCCWVNIVHNDLGSRCESIIPINDSDPELPM